jgi:hypothetical protein
MFGKYDINLAEATHVKNYLLRNNLVQPQVAIFGSGGEKNRDKELILDFDKGYGESIKLGATGPSPTQYNSQKNFASFGKAKLRLTLQKNGKIEITLTIVCAHGVNESNGKIINWENVFMYHAEVPIDYLLKI